MFPIEAVTFTVPVVVLPDTNVTRPADTVARLVLLEVQVATEVTSNGPLQVCAVAVMGPKLGSLVVTLPLVMSNVIDVTQPTVTVTAWVPVMVGFWLEVAVTVAVPISDEVTRPPEEIVATAPVPLEGMPLIDQLTDGLVVVLPSLLVPTAVICIWLFVFPVSIVGVAGPTAREVKVGFTKNPVQLTANASIASPGRAPATRSLGMVEDIVI